MTDSVKCVAFNELLKQAESVEEIATIFEQMESRVELKLEDRRALHRFGKKRMVSVDVLKGFCLVKEHRLRKLLTIISNLIEQTQAENDKLLETVNEDQQCPDQDAQVALRSAYWNSAYIVGLQQIRGLFDETFSVKSVKGSLQEKKESGSQ